MKKNLNTLKIYFSCVEKLIAKMQEDPYYTNETRILFSQAIPEMDMTKAEVEEYFKDNLVKSQLIATKLNRWFEGFLKNHLSKSTPNELMNEQIINPKINSPLTVKNLKILYQLPQSERTIYNWIKQDKLLPSSNSGTRKYYRVDFEHLLINKGLL